MTALGPRVRTLLSPVVDIRPGETQTVGLMFGYAFFAMTSYNIVQPVTRSVFISDLGADNIPYVLLAGGLLIGLIMQLYGRVVSILPDRWALPTVQLGLSLVLLSFFLGFRVGGAWVSSGFYMFGQVLGALLLSQFWTLANEVYDPRQARRLFGFIGGGASLSGMAGSGLAVAVTGRIGTDALLLVSAGALVLSSMVVAAVLTRERRIEQSVDDEPERPSGSLVEAWKAVRESPNLRQLALLISFSAVGAMVVDQQLNLAAEAFRGGDQDAVTSFLASVRFLLSTVALVMQIVLIKHIYRLLGVGFALLMLPVSLAGTSALILFTGALWAPAVASVVDRSIRYTVDRTTREIFFLPLPSAVKLRVKTFIDVTADRVARGLGAVLVLVAIKPWGLALDWPQLSVLTLVLAVAWLRVAARARERYVSSIRQSLQTESIKASDIRVGVADLTTVETLLEELAHPDERRVLYAIDVLESFDKRNLVTPLLLHHESAAVRARAITVIGDSRGTLPEQWRSAIQRRVDDPDPEVRARAILTLAKVQNQNATRLARTLVEDVEKAPRMAASAAVVLAASPDPHDVETAEITLTRLATDLRDTSSEARRDAASAIGQIDHPRIRQLLIPLLQDSTPEVSEHAMQSVRSMHPPDALFVPTLVSLLGDRRVKSGARDALVDYGPPVLEMLGHVLFDPDEDRWIRLHVPATIARIPCQTSMDLLVRALDDDDRFIRYKAIAGMETLRRRDVSLTFPRTSLESALKTETFTYFDLLVLSHDLFERGGMPPRTVLHRVLAEKMERAVHGAFRLLALLYPWRD